MKNYRDYYRLAKKLDNLDDFLLTLPDNSYTTGPSNGVIASSEAKDLTGKTAVRFFDRREYRCEFIFQNKSRKFNEKETNRSIVSILEKEALSGLSRKRLNKWNKSLKELREEEEYDDYLAELIGKRKEVLKAEKKGLEEIDFIFGTANILSEK